MVPKYTMPADGKTQGENHPQHKLTAEQVFAIRAQYDPRKRRQKVRARDLAREYEVGVNAILDIWHRRTWKHI